MTSPRLRFAIGRAIPVASIYNAYVIVDVCDWLSIYWPKNR